MFLLFSTVEYWLKRVGFHAGNGTANPNWDKFADSIEVADMFVNNTDQQFLNAVTYIKGHPPKKQVIRDGKLDWDPAPPGNMPDARLVLTYVRRIRNNLFHGGEFNGEWFNPDRSEVLIDFAIVILNACVRCSADVTEAYDNGITI